ncbi:MAG TPA: pseudouridine synthase [Burkholderiales bacterium]|jgi:23S rRNA pseudouridine2457 synthase|nr:pseudouridine synthase [Burkholderiales bacterium]
MSQLILFNKPYGVLCQFSRDSDRPCLADYIEIPGVYPAGRLDADSEGLVLLTDDGALQARIADPAHKLPKTYWAQVEGLPDEAALHALRAGVTLREFKARPAEARLIAEPAGLWPRNPPIRVRQHIPTSWLELILREGKNRQVRRMTAQVGFPTLRLIRWSVGSWTLEGLGTGEYRAVPAVL